MDNGDDGMFLVKGETGQGVITDASPGSVIYFDLGDGTTGLTASNSTVRIAQTVVSNGRIYFDGYSQTRVL